MVYLIFAIQILPLPLLVIAWSRKNRRPTEFSILSVSAVLLLSADVRSLKLALLGTDYSNRLFATMDVNFLVALALGIYLGIMGKRAAAVAALILAIGWGLMAAVNSAV